MGDETHDAFGPIPESDKSRDLHRVQAVMAYELSSVRRLLDAESVTVTINSRNPDQIQWTIEYLKKVETTDITKFEGAAE